MSNDNDQILQQFRADYSYANVHLSWAKKKERLLYIFGLVELLPQEFPRPLILGPESRAISKTGWSLGFRRIVTTVEDAYDYYMSFLHGRLLDFDYSSGSLRRDVEVPGAEIPKSFNHLPLDRMKVPAIGDSSVPPYLASWHICPRIHECLAREQKHISDFLNNQKHIETAVQWFAERLFFNIEGYAEYLGGTVLVAPNPLFRKVDSQPRVDPSDSMKESVVLRVHPRKDRAAKGLRVICTEKDTGNKVERVLEGDCTELFFGHKIQEVSEEIICPVRGTLYRTAPLGFIRSIKLDMLLTFAQYELNVKDEATGKECNVIAQKEERMPSLIGEDTSPMPFLNQKLIREQEKEGTKYEQHWFGGEQQEAAKDYLHSILRRATKQAWIVDPYFGFMELAEYFSAVGDWSVRVNILTSAEFLRKRRGKKESIAEEGDALWQLWQKLAEDITQGNKHLLPFSIKVMAGEKPPVHDRFIVADNRVWIIGSSLNELGSRGTVTLRLPDPWMVLPVLSDEWGKAIPLEEWIADRSIRRKAETAGESSEGDK